jgi:hypothetical protein
VYFKSFIFLCALLHLSFADAQEKGTLVLQVKCSMAAGHYPGEITVRLEANPGHEIYYTLDGSRPSKTSNHYRKPFKLAKTATLRAVAGDGRSFSSTITRTFLIAEPNHGMPIVSVTMSPSTLFHPKYGIMMEGAYAQEQFEHKPGANFWTRKEYLCNVEIFEDDKTCVHNSLAGFRIFGGYSRVFPQKSFVLVSRKRYGSNQFDGEIFPKGEVNKYKYLVLRNGGSDWNGAHFRDELMSSLMDDWNVEKQNYRPAIVYLNGRYWGIYYIREKINTRFLADHMDIDKDSIDLLEHRNTVRSGTIDAYQRLVRFVENADLSDPKQYERLKSAIDIDNFIDYQIAQIYCVNQDAGGNIRYWRPQTRNGKWRWIFFDMDWGFGLHNPQAYKSNTLKFFTEPNGPTWPNPPWSTLFLRSMLRSDAFKARFVNRLCDRLNTDFAPEYVLSKIAQFEDELGPAMPRHLAKWGLNSKDWVVSVNNAKEFARLRPEYLRGHIETFIGLGAHAEVEIVPAAGGQTLVNGAITVANTVYHGHYYENYPIELVAKSNTGYRFVGWEGWPEKKMTINAQLKAGKILRLRPKFEVYQHPLADQVILNEICAFNKKSGDWIEIYNKTEGNLNLAGWKLIDQKEEFILPLVTIAPKGFVIVCKNALKFRATHPMVDQPIIDGLSFGLDKSVEQLVLTTAEGDMIDSISYRIEPPASDYTIDLLLPTLESSKPDHWSAHLGKGSPGMDNPLLFSQLIGGQKSFLTRLGLGIGLLVLAIMALWWRKKN